MFNVKQSFSQAQQAGCSVLVWHTADGCPLFGRNFDFNRLASGTQVLFIPRHTNYHTYGTTLEGDLDPTSHRRSEYAMLGIGTQLLQSAPALYEGMNECGLMGAQLNFRELAQFPTSVRPNTHPVQPPFVVTDLLAQCASLDEAVSMLRDQITLIGRPILDTIPTLHWAFADRTGETVVVECDADGLHIHRNTLGVLTNSPDYRWHELNLLNYAHVCDQDDDTATTSGQTLCFSGSGSAELPGGWTSPARFIRLAFAKRFAIPGTNETEGVARLFRLMQTVAFPLGLIRVGDAGVVTKYDQNVVSYDYTVYTSVMCAQSLRFYWTTYDTLEPRYLDLGQLCSGEQPLSFDLTDNS